MIRPGGLYVVCVAQRPSPGDRVGIILSDMAVRVDTLRRASRPRGVTVDEVLVWAGDAGFTGSVVERERQWISSPEQELNAISHRQWPAIRELDEAAVQEATRPAVEALKALPATDVVRRATAEIVVLRRP